MSDRLIKAQELALLIDVSVYTINIWYRWKKNNPEHELSKLLPDFEQIGARQTRFWHYDDVTKLIEFKAKLPRGKNGILGSITQKYRRINNGKN